MKRLLVTTLVLGALALSPVAVDNTADAQVYVGVEGSNGYAEVNSNGEAQIVVGTNNKTRHTHRRGRRHYRCPTCGRSFNKKNYSKHHHKHKCAPPKPAKKNKKHKKHHRR